MQSPFDEHERVQRLGFAPTVKERQIRGEAQSASAAQGSNSWRPPIPVLVVVVDGPVELEGADVLVEDWVDVSVVETEVEPPAPSSGSHWETMLQW